MVTSDEIQDLLEDSGNTTTKKEDSDGDVKPDVLIQTYAFLALTAPMYPFWVVLNALGCGSGCGYYNFIPQFILPHGQRPNPYGSDWPGVKW